MPLQDLNQIYPCRNLELRSIVHQMAEFGRNIAKEPSAAMTSGLDEWAVGRQASYIEHAKARVEALNGKPHPDMPATHPLSLPINLSDPYEEFVITNGGEQVPINESTALLSEYWLISCVELAKSNSAAVAGGIIEFDYRRAMSNLERLTDILAEIAARPILDLPETANPGSTLGFRTPRKP